MTAAIRLASETDAAAINEIYAPFCEKTAISFEYVAPTDAEMAERIRTLIAIFPWLVLVNNQIIAGYAYASRHRERAAYGWSVDTTVYVRPAYQRRGAGLALYTTLFELLKLQGYYRAFAGVTLPNLASVGLHTALGFEPVGIFRGVGFKLGAWHDVAWFQLSLQTERGEPAPPVPITNIVNSPGWNEAVKSGLRCYRDKI